MVIFPRDKWCRNGIFSLIMTPDFNQDFYFGKSNSVPQGVKFIFACDRF